MGYVASDKRHAGTFPELIEQDLDREKVDGYKWTTKDVQSTASSGNPRLNIDRLYATVLSTANSYRFGQLYGDFLRARKEVFIDMKAWSLAHVDGMEFDQYDTPQSRSVVVHEFGRVLGGVRLLPTMARCGCYSYMLRDAQLGLLEDIPDYVLYEEAPVAPHVWEATRLFISSSVAQEQRLAVQTKLMLTMANAARKEGASHVIGIVPAIFQRWLGRLGIGALPLGPKLTIGGDHTQAAAMHVAGSVAGDADHSLSYLLN